MKRAKSTFDSSEGRSSKEGAADGRRRFRLVEWCSSSVGSVLIHLVILFLLFLAVRGGSKSGILGTRQTDEVGIVFTESTLAESSNSEAAKESTTDAETSASEETSSETTDEDWRQAAESLLPSNEIGVTDTVGGVSSHEALNAATSAASGDSGNGQTVGFSGSRGSGKTFVYVIDRSDSMGWKGGAPMRRAIADAVASVRSLDPKLGATKFQVVVFNHDVEVFNSGNSLIDVNPANKTKCIRFLDSLAATGGTSPEQALSVGLRMRPDVVFFLTDADEELSEQTLERIQSLRRQCKVKQICVIEFRRSTDPVKKTFKRLAGENGGTYAFKDVDLL